MFGWFKKKKYVVKNKITADNIVEQINSSVIHDINKYLNAGNMFIKYGAPIVFRNYQITNGLAIYVTMGLEFEDNTANSMRELPELKTIRINGDIWRGIPDNSYNQLDRRIVDQWYDYLKHISTSIDTVAKTKLEQQAEEILKDG